MITTSVDLPDPIINAIGKYLDRHRTQSWESLFQAALALYLSGHGCDDPALNEIILANTFTPQERGLTHA